MILLETKMSPTFWKSKAHFCFWKGVLLHFAVKFALDFFHVDVFDAFVEGRDDGQNFVKFSDFDEFADVTILQIRNDECAAGIVVVPQFMPDEDGTEARGIDVFDIIDIEDDVWHAFVAQKSELRFEGRREQGVQIFVVQRKDGVFFLFIN